MGHLKGKKTVAYHAIPPSLSLSLSLYIYIYIYIYIYNVCFLLIYWSQHTILRDTYFFPNLIALDLFEQFFFS